MRSWQARTPSTPPCRTPPGSGTTGWAARTTSRPTARRATSSSTYYPAAAGQGARLPPLPVARRALPGPASRAYGSSSTSARACRPPTTPTRSPSGWPRRRGSSTSTTTRWCSPTPARCSPARPRAPPATSTPTCTTPRRSSPRRPKTLDFDQPVALLMIGVLGHVADYDEARSIVRALLDGLPSGSYLVETDGTDSSPEYIAAIEMYRDSGGVPYNARTHEQIAGLLRGAGAGRARRGADPPVAARAQRVRRGPRRLRVRRRRPEALIPCRTRRCSGRCAESTGRPAGARLV